MNRSAIQRKFDHWRYLGYDRETLALYENRIAADNMKILGGALVIAAIVTILELIFTWGFALSGEGVTDSLLLTGRLMLFTGTIIAVLGAVYLYARKKPNKPFYCRLLTTVFLALWSILYIIIGTVIDPEDYAVMACGLFLLIQVMFDAYPLENLAFALSAYGCFAIMGYIFKPTEVFLYDMIDALPFFLVGLFLSWIKSRSKWAALINADAMVLLEKQRMENQLTQARISIMLSQIQPHFLYNSLTAIYTLCDIDPAAAKEAVGEFSEYLRGNLDSLKLENPVPFDTELKHVETYLKLEKMRFRDELNIVYDIQTTGFMVPALTVQPLIENAVKYGVGQAEDGGTVTLSTREYADRFEIIVSDDGVGFDPYETQADGRTHIGIENVKTRLWEMSQASLAITSVKKIGTTAVITLPKEEPE